MTYILGFLFWGCVTALALIFLFMVVTWVTFFFGGDPTDAADEDSPTNPA